MQNMQEICRKYAEHAKKYAEYVRKYAKYVQKYAEYVKYERKKNTHPAYNFIFSIFCILLYAKYAEYTR